ncbi:Six-hairpin glycosidase [Rhizodiscina lignyota]|uniref:Six-hairpin glycosidase n=1 Tax=Rhizodiscina lignyota TaxID=1504668 RepID=A0A9P4IH74_9PEZI|nr:Six-hairpin glycosidase [Rhizodiscina lignyota]
MSLQLLSFFLCFILFQSQVIAQSCWRNLTCTGPEEQAFSGPWSANIYAPSSRTVSPASYFSPSNIHKTTKYGQVSLKGNGSTITYDFGKEVGGIATIEYSSTGSGAGSIGLAFTEAANWIGQWSDSSNGKFMGPDGAIYGNFSGPGTHSYTMPDKVLRGGFRYLTVFLLTESDVTVKVSSVKLEIGFQPTWSNLQAYQGYFHSSDDELNKIWYSGAYTLQTNAVPVTTGRWVPMVTDGWANNGTLGPGDTIIVDGAKRDRAVWPGDMGIAVPSTFVSIGDLDSVKNALQVMYNNQNADGSFPEAGPPLLQQGSDTYHMWSMIGTYNYVLFTDDIAFLQENWAKYLHAMEYIYGKVLPPGLLNVTGTRDWARWQQGWNNTEANIILYRTLITGSDLATWMGNSSLSSTYTSRASNLKTAINKYCWDGSYGAFKDNATATALHPQDANSMAILFNVASPYTSRSSSISSKLLKNWTPIGAQTPELPNNISPFISSFEIQAHLSIGETDRALDLIRRTWGWYLNNENGTQSTVIEGYLTNGSFGYRNSRGYDYDSSYVSHSHGWSSGPTSAMTNYLLGLSVTAPAGSEWQFAPQFGDLSWVEGGFTTKLGKLQGSWKLNSKSSYSKGYSATLSTPKGTKGEVVLPVLQEGKAPKVKMDGKTVKPKVSGSTFSFSAGGGSHSFEVS